jgi:4a-hydroxytetrahydrobiopterin dehydratase
MRSANPTSLATKKCRPCEGGAPPLSRDEVTQLLTGLPQWRLAADAKSIRREWRVKDFPAALDFFRRIGEVAEAEDHHPDLHLTGYRNVAVELSTHAVGGLTENDFILAAKIDQLPVALKT